MKTKRVTRYRIEWFHNYQWRMAWGHEFTYDTRREAEENLKANPEWDNVKTRIVEVK